MNVLWFLVCSLACLEDLHFFVLPGHMVLIRTYINIAFNLSTFATQTLFIQWRQQVLVISSVVLSVTS
jgi:hypothetical protein